VAERSSRIYWDGLFADVKVDREAAEDPVRDAVLRERIIEQSNRRERCRHG